MNPENDQILQKIAQRIASLPSDDLLQKCQTQAQIDEWHKARKTQLLLAECWRAKFLVKNYYLIDEAVDRQKISQRKADIIALSIAELKSRWELCKIAETYVKELHSSLQSLACHIIARFPKITLFWYDFFCRVPLTPYPFQSPYDLFVETLKEDADGSFSVCLEPYYEVSMKKSREAVNQYTKLLEQAESNGIYPKLNHPQEQKLKGNFFGNKVSFSWLGMLLFVSQIKAPDDPLLRKNLVAYHKSLRELLTLAVKASRNLHSWAWKKGELHKASAAGGVYGKA